MLLDYTHNSSGLPVTKRIYQDFTPDLHWTRDLLISFVLNGQLEIYHKNRTSTYRDHDFFFFLPYETCSIVRYLPDTRILSVFIDGEYLARLTPDLKKLSFRKNHVRCDMSDPLYRSLCRSESILLFEDIKQGSTSRLLLLNAVNEIAMTLMDNFGILEEDPGAASDTSDRPEQVLTYINAHYQERITVKEIASHLGLHPQYFSSWFQKAFHTGFVEYLNTFRINSSLSDLLHTEHSIMEIALDHGFSNHKTYAAAFRRLYQTSPTAWRAQQRKSSELSFTENIGQSDTDRELLTFFQLFLADDVTAEAGLSGLSRERSLQFNTAELSRRARRNQPERFLSLGRAYSCLRAEIQAQIREVRSDYKFQHLRIRDIFSDDLNIYYERDNHTPLYNWAYLDSVFDFILSVGLRPFPEIGYMPQALAAKKQYANWQYHPNVSAPKSMERWQEFIEAFLRHYLDRYGTEELESWYFDFWTDPDLEIQSPFWYESMETFFEFYHTTWRAFQNADPHLRLGSPNFSRINGEPWYRAFFRYCTEHHLNPAYIAVHLYGCEGTFPRNLMQQANRYSVANQDAVPEQVDTLQRIMNQYGFGEKPILVSDWNLTFLPADLIRDTCYMGPYLCHTFNRTLFSVKGLSFWSLNDNYEDFFLDSGLFHGGPGLLDIHSIKKASYNALRLIGMLGTHVLASGDGYLLAKEGHEYQLLLYNLPAFDPAYAEVDAKTMDETHRYHIYSSNEGLLYHIALQVPTGTYYIKRYEVNREYGSAYDLWGQMGFPSALTQDMEEYLRAYSRPHISYSFQHAQQALLLDETVPAHGILLLQLIPR